MKYAIRVALAAVAATSLLGGAAWADDATMDGAHRKQAQELMAGGVKFLLSAREEDGGWSMGGGVVMQYALDHPALSLTLQAPVSPYGFGGTR